MNTITRGPRPVRGDAKVGHTGDGISALAENGSRREAKR